LSAASAKGKKEANTRAKLFAAIASEMKTKECQNNECDLCVDSYCACDCHEPYDPADKDLFGDRGLPDEDDQEIDGGEVEEESED
jgi:hypothetical protein